MPILLLCIVLLVSLTACENTENLRKGLHLQKTGDTKEAIEHFKKFLAENPETEKKETVTDLIAECYFTWADNEKQLKHWEKGVDLMQVIIDEYSETRAAEKVEDALPEFLLEWGTRLSHDGSFIESLTVLKRLISHFPASSFAQRGRDLRNSIGIIAFNSGTDIFVMNSDGTRLRKIAESAISPTISPDGKKIAYIKIKKSTDKKGYLYISNIDGRKAKQLLDNPVASEPVFSPDGANILITKGDAFQKVDLSGRTINAYFGIRDFDTVGSFNPTGQQVVTFLKNPRGSTSRLCTTEDFESYIELTTTEKDPIRDAAWSLDNLRIVFVTGTGLHTISPEGLDQQEFILSESMDDMDIRSVNIAPTGSNIIFVGKNKTDENFKLYYVTLNKDVRELEIIPDKAGNVPVPSAGQVSWGYGYLRY